MPNEIVETRLERCHAGLPQAVKSSDGAHFRMLLSLLSSNQSTEYSPAVSASAADFALPETSSSALRYPNTEQLYTAEVVDRMNRSVNQDERGEFAFSSSWVDTQSNTPEGYNALGDSLERVAMQVNGKLMIAQIDSARSSISAEV